MDAYCPIEQRKTQAHPIIALSFGQIVRCEPSGLLRFYPPRSPVALAAVHATPEYFAHPYFEARRNLKRDNLLAKLRAILQTIAGHESLAGKRLLDIGCDTGTLLTVARDDFQMEVTGVEVSPQAAKVAREEHQLEVKVGQIADLNLLSESYDVVTLIDVIEHVSDPGELLRAINRILLPGGRLYVVTADHDALINTIGLGLDKVLGKAARFVTEKLYIPYHEYYFTRKTLALLLERNGFHVQQHLRKEFPLDEFGHGRFFKLGLRVIFALQGLLQRQTLQEVIAVKD